MIGSCFDVRVLCFYEFYLFDIDSLLAPVGPLLAPCWPAVGFVLPGLARRTTVCQNRNFAATQHLQTARFSRRPRSAQQRAGVGPDTDSAMLT